MILTEDKGIGDYHIRAYEAGAITVNEITYRKSLIVSPFRLIVDWPPQSLNELNEAHLQAILDLTPKIVIIGTGRHFALPPTEKLAAFYEGRIGVECMDTGAACRTYTALMSEGRHVVAALLIE